MAKTIALVIATVPEFRRLAALWPLQPGQDEYTYRFHNADVVVCIAGVGPDRAPANVEQLLAERNVDQLILCGFAGGLDPDLETGSVVVPQRIIDGRGNAAALSDQQQPTILTAEQIVTQPQQKCKLYARHGAVAVDMESFAIAQVAAGHSVPLTIIRAVLDTAEQSLPAAIHQWVDTQGRTRWSRIWRDILIPPWHLHTLARLGLQARKAAVPLAKHVTAALQRIIDA